MVKCDRCGTKWLDVSDPAMQSPCPMCELEALKAKLPKCWRLNAAGELVQDGPLLPGSEVFNFPATRCTSGEAVMQLVSACKLVVAAVGYRDVLCETHNGVRVWLPVFRVASTREAVEAAQEEK